MFAGFILTVILQNNAKPVVAGTITKLIGLPTAEWLQRGQMPQPATDLHRKDSSCLLLFWVLGCMHHQAREVGAVDHRPRKCLMLQQELLV